MKMGMVKQILPPGVQDTEEANLGTKVFRIRSDLQKGCSAGSKQQGVDQLLIVKCQRRKCVWNRKDQMHVGNVQKLPLTSGQPPLPGVVETLRTMSITAAVVRDGDDVTALRTTVSMASECGCPAAHNCRQHLSVQSGHPGLLFLKEVFTCRSYNIGHLQGRPIHCSRFFRDRLVLVRSKTGSSSSGFGQARK